MSYYEALVELFSSDEPTKRIVWTADLEYWIAGMEVRGAADPTWRTEQGFLKLCRDLAVMPYYWYRKFWLAEPRYDRSVSVSSTKHDDVTVTTWQTPKGTLTREERFVHESCSVAHTKPAVQTNEDLDILRYLMDHRSLVPSSLDSYEKRRQLWRQWDGLPALALPRSPLAAFLYEWAGLTEGIYLIIDHMSEITDLFELMSAQEEPILDAVCEASPPLVHFADNMSSDNMTGFYAELMESGHRRRLDRLHGAGIAAAVHLDGTVRGLLPKLAEVGFDAIEAVTPQPSGDAEVEDLRRIAQNDRVILWGGVPGVLFAPPYTWPDVERHVARLLQAWRGTRFIVGVADQIPPDGNADYCPRIAEMCAAASK